MAAGPHHLMLQSLKARGDAAMLPLLEQLPASFLTHLDLHVPRQLQEEPAQLAYSARLSAALSRLTALCSLVLFSASNPSLDLPGLSALRQLTALYHGGPLSNLQHLPGQLLDLHIGRPCMSTQEQQPLDLRRLTALVYLFIW